MRLVLELVAVVPPVAFLPARGGHGGVVVAGANGPKGIVHSVRICWVRLAHAKYHVTVLRGAEDFVLRLLLSNLHASQQRLRREFSAGSFRGAVKGRLRGQLHALNAAASTAKVGRVVGEHIVRLSLRVEIYCQLLQRLLLGVRVSFQLVELFGQPGGGVSVKLELRFHDARLGRRRFPLRSFRRLLLFDLRDTYRFGLSGKSLRLGHPRARHLLPGGVVKVVQNNLRTRPGCRVHCLGYDILSVRRPDAILGVRAVHDPRARTLGGPRVRP